MGQHGSPPLVAGEQARPLPAAAPLRPRALLEAQGRWEPLRAHLGPLGLVLALHTALAVVITAVVFGRADVAFFYSVAVESARGRFPLLQFWMEYPPLYPWLSVGLLRLAELLAPGERERAFALLLSGVNLACETANVVLVYAIAHRLEGRRQALRVALVYALLFPPLLFAAFGAIEPFAEACLLGALLAGQARRGAPAGALVALGTLAKFYPATALPALLAWLPRLERRRCLASVVVPVGAVALLFAVLAPRALLGSAEALATRPPWESPWVLVEGCCVHAPIPPPEQREATPTGIARAPGRVPWLLVTVLFAGAYVAVLAARRAPMDERAVLSLTLFTLALLVLWSKGFSPQFGAWILPLLLLVFPGRVGMVLAAAYCPFLIADYALPIVPPALFLTLYAALAVTRALFTLLIAIRAAARWLRPVSAPPQALPA